MEGVPDTTSSWMWWIFSVVVVSLVVNIASAYLKPILDIVGARFSDQRRKRIEEQRREFEEIVTAYASVEGITSLKIDILRLDVIIALILLLSIVISNAVFYWLRFTFLGDIFVDFLRALIYFVSIIVFLFFVNRRRKMKAVLRRIYETNAPLVRFFDR